MMSQVNTKAAIWSGVIAGAVFMMLEMGLVGTVGGESPWGPPRMIAAMAMGESVLPPPATFEGGIMMVAMMIHFAMSIVFGFVLGWVISHWRMSLAIAMVAGTVFGLLVYFLNFYLMTAIFPWFAMARGGISIFAHAMFGLVLGWAYHAIATPVAAASGRRHEEGHLHD